MKITETSKRNETVFRNVKPGTVFKYERDYYLKTIEIEDCCNCVTLDKGNFFELSLNTMVEVLDAELIIK